MLRRLAPRGRLQLAQRLSPRRTPPHSRGQLRERLVGPRTHSIRCVQGVSPGVACAPRLRAAWALLGGPGAEYVIRGHVPDSAFTSYRDSHQRKGSDYDCALARDPLDAYMARREREIIGLRLWEPLDGETVLLTVTSVTTPVLSSNRTESFARKLDA